MIGGVADCLPIASVSKVTTYEEYRESVLRIAAEVPGERVRRLQDASRELWRISSLGRSGEGPPSIWYQWFAAVLREEIRALEAVAPCERLARGMGDELDVGHAEDVMLGEAAE